MLNFAKRNAEQQNGSKTLWTEDKLVLSCISRAQPALLTLLSSFHPEITFTVLMYISQLLSLSPSIAKMFANSWNMFLPFYTDKPHNQILRLQILQAIMDEVS